MSVSGKIIQIKDFAFAPAELMISSGDTVIWINSDGFAHSVASDSGAWSSPELAKGAQFTLVGPRPGRYPYHCAAHPTMRGVLLIK